MSNGAGDERPAVAGLPVEDAVDAVVDADDDLDTATARAALQSVATDDGVVSPAAAADAVGETAMVVSTPETRAELAAIALSDASDAAHSEDLAAVAARLDGFESRLDSTESRIEALAADLETLVEHDVEDADLVAVGQQIQQIRADANDLQRAADELQMDLEEFEEWLEGPAVRAAEMEADVDAIADSLAEREEVLDAIAANGAGMDDEAGTADGALQSDDLGAVWAEAAVDNRVSALVLADVRAELADLRTMAERQADAKADDEAADLDAVDARVADLAERRDAIGERLEELARPAWRERFDDWLAAVEAVVADAEPPVAWGRLQAAIDDAQS